MAIEGHADWHDKTALMGRIEQQLEDLRLVKGLLRRGLIDRQQLKAALLLRAEIRVSLATSLLLTGGISLDALSKSLHDAREGPKA